MGRLVGNLRTLLWIVRFCESRAPPTRENEKHKLSIKCYVSRGLAVYTCVTSRPNIGKCDIEFQIDMGARRLIDAELQQCGNLNFLLASSHRIAASPSPNRFYTSMYCQNSVSLGPQRTMDCHRQRHALCLGPGHGPEATWLPMLGDRQCDTRKKGKGGKMANAIQ